MGAPLLLIERIFIRQNGRRFGYSMQYLPSTIDFSEAAAKLLIERVEAGNALPEPERRIFTTHMKPVFERKVTLPKPDAAPTETDEKEK